MGLLDQVIAGVAGGGRGQPASGGGTSPLMKALLLLLAAKAAGHYLGKSHGTGSTPAPSAPPSGNIESGILAGMPSLDSILDHLKGAGHGDAVQSWIGSGPNKTVPPADLERSIGRDNVDQLAQQSGMPRDQLLRELSDSIPKVVDGLSPDGRMPSTSERAHW